MLGDSRAWNRVGFEGGEGACPCSSGEPNRTAPFRSSPTGCLQEDAWGKSGMEQGGRLEGSSLDLWVQFSPVPMFLCLGVRAMLTQAVVTDFVRAVLAQL